MTTQQLILIDAVALVLLGITVYLTRATIRRTLGALAAGVAIALFCVGLDTLGYFLGWWYYPFVDTPYGPPLMYVAAGLWYGAGVALIGWRVTRRFGWRGQVAFLGVMAIFGPVRDYTGAALSGAFVFAPGLVPVLVDAACWVSGIGLGQLVMRLVAGPAGSDRLARTTTIQVGLER